jgi:hypothetical protein
MAAEAITPLPLGEAVSGQEQVRRFTALARGHLSGAFFLTRSDLRVSANTKAVAALLPQASGDSGAVRCVRSEREATEEQAGESME